MSETQPFPARAATVDEPDLFCPHCDYNVRGLPAEVCPECGNAFDRKRLIRWTTGLHVPLRFWRSDGGSREPSIFLSSLFTPARLGRELPVFADLGEAGNYAMGMRVWAAIMAAVWSAILSKGEALVVSLLVVPVPVIVGSLVCEGLVAWELSRWVRPRSVPRYARYKFWRNLCRCCSTHLLVAPIAGCLAALIAVAAAPQSLFLLTALVLACGFAWWWVCLARAIIARGSPGFGMMLGVLTIPLHAIVAAWLGGMAAGPVALVIAVFLQ